MLENALTPDPSPGLRPEEQKEQNEGAWLAPSCSPSQSERSGSGEQLQVPAC